VVSEAGKLKAKHIIHAVGPRFQEAETERKLLDTMLNCLAAAEEKGMKTLAFPLMGAGYYGIPPTVSAGVMMEALKTHLDGDSGIQEILICVFDTPHFNAVQAAMAAKL
jgi:O-acetyl-ADP-ribose deacetylase (regulator of RNase III)